MRACIITRAARSDIVLALLCIALYRTASRRVAADRLGFRSTPLMTLRPSVVPGRERGRHAVIVKSGWQ